MLSSIPNPLSPHLRLLPFLPIPPNPRRLQTQHVPALTPCRNIRLRLPKEESGHACHAISYVACQGLIIWQVIASGLGISVPDVDKPPPEALVTRTQNYILN